MSLFEFLSQLDQMIDHVWLEEADELTDVLDELVPELDDLCKNAWLLEIILKHCKRRAS